MQTVKFKQSGILFYLHKILFVNNPKDTCTYKFQLIVSFITAMVTIHATVIRIILFLIPSLREDDDNWGIKMHFIAIMTAVLTLIVGHAMMEDSGIFNDFIYWSEINLFTFTAIMYSFLTQLIGLVTCIIGLAAIALIIGIFYYTYKALSWITRGITSTLPPITNDKGEPNTQIGVLYTSTKEKWCKIITWEQ